MIYFQKYVMTFAYYFFLDKCIYNLKKKEETYMKYRRPITLIPSLFRSRI